MQGEDSSLDHSVAATLSRLAPREREYLILFLQENEPKEIAYRMNTSVSFVSKTRARVFTKLSIQNDLQLVLFGIRVGLIDLDGQLLACQHIDIAPLLRTA